MIFASRSFSFLYTYSNIHFVTLVYIYLLSNQKLGNLWLMYVSSRQGYFFAVVIKDKKYICCNLHAHFKCFETWRVTFYTISILVICIIFLCRVVMIISIYFSHIADLESLIQSPPFKYTWLCVKISSNKLTHTFTCDSASALWQSYFCSQWQVIR